MRKLITLSVLFATLFSPLPGIAKTITSQKDISKDELNICETVFRFQFDYNHSAIQRDANAYYLQILGGDPAPEFLARFKKQKPPVQLGSQFKRGEHGLLFKILSIQWVAKNAVEVKAGFDEEVTIGATYHYYLERSFGKWDVKRSGLEEIR